MNFKKRQSSEHSGWSVGKDCLSVGMSVQREGESHLIKWKSPIIICVLVVLSLSKLNTSGGRLHSSVSQEMQQFI